MFTSMDDRVEKGGRTFYQVTSVNGCRRRCKVGTDSVGARPAPGVGLRFAVNCGENSSACPATNRLTPCDLVKVEFDFYANLNIHRLPIFESGLEAPLPHGLHCLGIKAQTQAA